MKTDKTTGIVCLNDSEKKRNRRSARRMGEAWLDGGEEKKMTCVRTVCVSERFGEFPLCV